MKNFAETQSTLTKIEDGKTDIKSLKPSTKTMAQSDEAPYGLSAYAMNTFLLLINLAKLDDLDLIVPPDAAYDSRLEETVRAFQQQHALKPDGIAGPNTIITLNTLTNKNIPTLLSKGLSKGLTKGVGS